METSPIDVKFDDNNSGNSNPTAAVAFDIVDDGGGGDGDGGGGADDDDDEVVAINCGAAGADAEKNKRNQRNTVASFNTIGNQVPPDNDARSSTSTLDAGLALDDSTGGAPFRCDTQDDISSLHGDGSNVNVDWLNNQMQVAIHSGVLDVMCKNYRGQLHLDKFGSGNRGKCIYAYSSWYTPSEFEVFCGRAQCKDWKRSIKFQGRSLLQLIELEILRVHAVSCSCASCWNGEAQEGPVRYHDVKRKSTTASASAASNAAGATKRLYTHSGTARQQMDVHTDQQQPMMMMKQLKLDMPPTGSSLNYNRLVDAAPRRTAVALSGTLVQSPGGTYRLVQTTNQHASNVVTASGSSIYPHAISVVLPGSPTKAACKPVFRSAQPTIVGTDRRQGIPLGLTYAPVQIVASSNQQQRKSLSLSSNGILADFAILEESVQGLQNQLASLRSQVKSLKALTERTLADATSRMPGATVERHKQMCTNCNHPATLTCAACRNVFYCSDFCVQKDAINHRDQCIPRSQLLHTVSID